jgi:RNA polymerase sigma factor (sigma-70 family)
MATSETGTADGYERMFLQELGTIRGIVAFIGRRRKLSASEIEEFAAHVNLKLVEGDYAVLRKFQGRSQLRTYLTVVINRIFLDWRTAEWGKWRPSASARQQGRVAILLERLTMRDGMPFEEALTVLETAHDVTIDRPALESMYARLPVRPRRQFAGESAMQDLPASYGDPSDGLVAEAEVSAFAETSRALSAELEQLRPEDRELLQSRFRDGLSVADIARATRQDARKLYRRFESVLGGLRARLAGRGIHPPAIHNIWS